MPTLGESVSEVSNLIPEPSNFTGVSKLPAFVKKAWLKATLKEIKNIINNHTFLMDDPEKGDQVTPCMGVDKAEIKYGGNLDNLNFIIVERVYLQNN